MPPVTVECNGQKIPLKRWAMRPAFKFGQQLSEALGTLGALDLEKLDFSRLAPLFAENHAELAVEMIARSLDMGGTYAQALALAEELGLVELAEVLKFNLGFIPALLKERKTRSLSPKPPSTPPQSN